MEQAVILAAARLATAGVAVVPQAALQQTATPPLPPAAAAAVALVAHSIMMEFLFTFFQRREAAEELVCLALVVLARAECLTAALQRQAAAVAVLAAITAIPEHTLPLLLTTLCPDQMEGRLAVAVEGVVLGPNM